MYEPLEHLYFNWLCAKVIRVEVPTPSLTYWKLLSVLHHTEFVWLVQGDDNRAEDGLELRQEFLTESGLPNEAEWWDAACSLLEMLIAFSRRSQFMVGNTSAFWFWHFIENLGLKEINDASDSTEEEIGEVLHNFVWRLYDTSGRGGLFPMSNPTEDQRQVEVWYQFCEYLVDKDWPI